MSSRNDDYLNALFCVFWLFAFALLCLDMFSIIDVTAFMPMGENEF